MASVSAEEVRPIVRRVLKEALGETGETATARTIVDGLTLADLPSGSRFRVPVGALVTPLARDIARERNIELVSDEPVESPTTDAARRVAIGADHGGYQLKEDLRDFLQTELGYDVHDVGPFDTESVDYPDYAEAVARAVSSGRCAAGIMIDGVGIGSCMAANKVAGVRASLCYDVSTARNAREHNHANVLTLGGQFIGPLLARQIVKAWLETEYGPGRHARRVRKIMEIERRDA